MGNKNINKEPKKKKASSKPAVISAIKSLVPQPEVIKKVKKGSDKDN